jgi:hypothetical protein
MTRASSWGSCRGFAYSLVTPGIGPPPAARLGVGGAPSSTPRREARRAAAPARAHAGFIDMGGTLGDQVVSTPLRPAQQLVPLDDLADDGPVLIATATLLSSDLFQRSATPR